MRVVWAPLKLSDFKKHCVYTSIHVHVTRVYIVCAYRSGKCYCLLASLPSILHKYSLYMYSVCRKNTMQSCPVSSNNCHVSGLLVIHCSHQATHSGYGGQGEDAVYVASSGQVAQPVIQDVLTTCPSSTPYHSPASCQGLHYHNIMQPKYCGLSGDCSRSHHQHIGLRNTMVLIIF